MRIRCRFWTDALSCSCGAVRLTHTGISQRQDDKLNNAPEVIGDLIGQAFQAYEMCSSYGR